MTRKIQLYTVLALVGTFVLAAMTAIGDPIPVGSLTGSKNATLDGQAALPHTALLNGDNLQVNDGLAMVALDQGNRMVMGRDTEVSFSREENAVTVSLTHGTMSLYHPKASRSFRVKVGDVVVAPLQAPKTLGEVAMVNGLLMVTVKEGTLQVEKAGTYQQVSAGKTITIAAPSAGTPSSMPQPNRDPKHTHNVSPKTSVLLGIGPEVGATAWAISAASSSGTPVSPVAP